MIKPLIDDVSDLTSVPTSMLHKFIPIIMSSIGHQVHEQLCEQKEIIVIDLEIGELQIKISNEDIRYKFVPSKAFQKIIAETVQTKTSPIVDKLESDLYYKIEKAYKEII